MVFEELEVCTRRGELGGWLTLLPMQAHGMIPLGLMYLTEQYFLGLVCLVRFCLFWFLCRPTPLSFRGRGNMMTGN
jgi:hypothetical protein